MAVPQHRYSFSGYIQSFKVKNFFLISKINYKIKGVKSHSIQHRISTRRKANQKAIRTLGLLLGSFVMAWCPFISTFFITSCFDIKFENQNQNHNLLDWLLLLGIRK